MKHYAEQLVKLCKRRNIDVGYRQELIKIDREKKEAVFKLLDKPDTTITIPVSIFILFKVMVFFVC